MDLGQSITYLPVWYSLCSWPLENQEFLCIDEYWFAQILIHWYLINLLITFCNNFSRKICVEQVNYYKHTKSHSAHSVPVKRHCTATFISI